MLAVTEVGFGTLPLMLVRVSRKPRLLLFDLPTLRVRLPFSITDCAELTYVSDANLFKEAFIRAQQENEALFSKA
jgi:hypothetical protein